MTIEFAAHVWIDGSDNPYPGAASAPGQDRTACCAFTRSTGTTPPGRFDTPEEVLVHELFHAMRQTFGALRNTPLDGDFDTVEELYSIFVQNMYANERNLRLRATHHRASSNVSPDHSMAHNPRFRAPLRDLAAMMPTIVNELANVRTRYNPFRDWKEFSRQG